MNTRSTFGAPLALAERTGLHPIYPGDDDPLAITRREIEAFALEVFADFALESRIGEATTQELARELAASIRRRFSRWVRYGSETDLDAPPRPDAVEGTARERLLRSFARTLHGRGLTHVEVVACCITLNESRCMPPLRDVEVAAIVSRAEPPRAVA